MSPKDNGNNREKNSSSSQQEEMLPQSSFSTPESTQATEKQPKQKDKKQRLDLVLVELGLAPTRHKAQGFIMAGQVYLQGQKVTKAGLAIRTEERPFLEVRGKVLPYVSRGGLKLEKAMHRWQIDLNGAICADIGASTGGFTDCMLQNGANYVYAVDSGYNQLDWKLRNHEKVQCMERFNARNLTSEDIPQQLDFFSVDVSFISLKLILPPLYPLLSDAGTAVCLIKPQFEAGREQVGKKGVVRDPMVHQSVVEKVLGHMVEFGFYVKDVTYSPIKGPEGNIEYLAYISKEPGEQIPFDCATLVAESHRMEDDHASATEFQPLS